MADCSPREIGRGAAQLAGWPAEDLRALAAPLYEVGMRLYWPDVLAMAARAAARPLGPARAGPPLRLSRDSDVLLWAKTRQEYSHVLQSTKQMATGAIRQALPPRLPRPALSRPRLPGRRPGSAQMARLFITPQMVGLFITPQMARLFMCWRALPRPRLPRGGGRARAAQPPAGPHDGAAGSTAAPRRLHGGPPAAPRRLHGGPPAAPRRPPPGGRHGGACATSARRPPGRTSPTRYIRPAVFRPVHDSAPEPGRG